MLGRSSPPVRSMKDRPAAGTELSDNTRKTQNTDSWGAFQSVGDSIPYNRQGADDFRF